MSWYPGWDSLDSVRTWHTVFEISGIAFLALLVGAEILAFQYGHRKDELTAIAEGGAETKRKNDAEAAEKRRKADVETLQDKLLAAERAAAEATKKANQVEARQADRRLTSEQKAVLRAAISAYPGQKARLVVLAGDNEAIQYAREFGDILHGAGWEIIDGGVAQVVYTGAAVPHGIQATVFGQQSVPGNTSHPAGIGAFVLTLQRLGLIKEIFSDPGIADDTVLIQVGPK